MSTDEELGAQVFGARIRARRKTNDLTLNELAARSGVSRAALSKIERGEQDTSVSNAMALARALGSDVGELLSAPEVTVTPASAVVERTDVGSGVVRRELPAPSPELSVIHYRLEPQAASVPFAAHRSGSRETFYILAGEVLIHTIDRTTLVHSGDIARAPGDVEHRISNPGAEAAELLLIIS